jgi:nitroreductase
MLVPPSPETYDRILGLRVVRAFTDEPVAEDDLAAVLEAGRWTGSSKNTQGWRLAVITDGDMQSRLADTGSFTDPVRNAPVTIALVSTPEGNDFDIGRLSQNLMLAAAARGLGSCPVSFHDESAAAELLGLPADHRCRWGVVMGHPAEAAERAARTARPQGMTGRKPVDDLLWR